MDAGIHGGAMDGFVARGSAVGAKTFSSAQDTLGMRADAQAASVGDEAMAHVDCDTIPYLWMYASRFALFDAFFQGARAPSAPSNVEIIAAQNGETEYMHYGAAGPPYTRSRPAPPDGACRCSSISIRLGAVQQRRVQQGAPSRPDLRYRAAEPRRPRCRALDELHA